jgi:hypothetical protein
MLRPLISDVRHRVEQPNLDRIHDLNVWFSSCYLLWLQCLRRKKASTSIKFTKKSRGIILGSSVVVKMASSKVYGGQYSPAIKINCHWRERID